MDNPGFDSRQGQEMYHFSEGQNGCGAHPVFHSVGNGDYFPGGKVEVRKPATDLQLMLRLRMSGAIPLVLLNAFIAWTGTTFNCAIILE
jgi:hypothetical protein